MNDAKQANSYTQQAHDKYLKALSVLEKLDEVLPAENVPYDVSSLSEAYLYLQLEESLEDESLHKKAEPILDYMWKNAVQNVTFFESFNSEIMQQYSDRCMRYFSIMRYIKSLYSYDEAKVEEMENQQMSLLETFVQKGGKLE